MSRCIRCAFNAKKQNENGTGGVHRVGEEGAEMKNWGSQKTSVSNRILNNLFLKLK